MIIYNIKRLLYNNKKYINWFAYKISKDCAEDYKQEISLYIYKNIWKFDLLSSSLSSYVYLLILTAYRRLIFDKNKQNVFEDSFGVLEEFCHSFNCKEDNTEELITNITNKLSDIQLVIFYALLNNINNKSYLYLSKSLKINYMVILEEIKKIKAICLDALNKE